MNNKNNKSQTHHKDQTQEQNESEVNIDKVNSKKTTSNSELEDTALINTDEIAAKITAEKESLTLNKDTKDTKDTKNNTQDDP
ncbi:MAG: hypothetical protein RR957_03655, partial [Oscillospiraceae bacterium]